MQEVSQSPRLQELSRGRKRSLRVLNSQETLLLEGCRWWETYGESRAGEVVKSTSRYGFTYSDAALAQYRAARRRSGLIALWALPTLGLALLFGAEWHHKTTAVVVVVIAAAGTLIIAVSDIRAGVAAQRRFKAERDAGGQAQ